MVDRSFTQPTSLSASSSGYGGHPFKPLWNAVWKANVPPKIKVFVWKVNHNILPIKVNLAAKGVRLELSCDVCNGASETVEHILVDCSLARAV